MAGDAADVNKFLEIDFSDNAVSAGWPIMV
jgi:hypothetical protein